MGEKHTAGPWSLDYKAHNCVADNEHALVANGIYVGRFTATIRAEDNGVANARLIAAAPDLLAALHEMMCEYRFELGNEYQKIAWKKARAAIAAATEGRS